MLNTATFIGLFVVLAWILMLVVVTTSPVCGGVASVAAPCQVDNHGNNQNHH